MMSCGLQPPAWLPVGRICLFWHRGLFHMEGQEQAIAVTRGVPCTAARLPFPMEIQVYPGAAQGEWAGVDLSKAPQLSGRPEEASAEVGLLP